MPKIRNRPNLVGRSALATTRAFPDPLPDCFLGFIANGNYSRLGKRAGLDASNRTFRPTSLYFATGFG
jgi:hypothetical protein